MSTRSNIVRSIGLTVIAGVGVVWIGTLPSPWAGWRPATCMPRSCFCEAARDSWVRQPVNAVTSLAFLAVAFAVLGLAMSRDRSSRLRDNILSSSPVYPALLALALALVGLGSAFFHASLSFVGQTSDVLGMYLLGTYLLLYAFARAHDLRPSSAATIYVVGNIVLLTLLVTVPEVRRYAFAAIILAASLLEWRAHRTVEKPGDVRLFALAVALLAAGSLVWTLDITGLVCVPRSWLQGHGVWHLLGAASSALIVSYYLSEGPRGGHLE